MDKIVKVDTHNLLKSFWEFIERGKYPKVENIFDEDQDDVVDKFLTTKYPEITDTKKDIIVSIKIAND